LKGLAFAIVLLLLINMLTLGFNIRPAKTKPATIIVPDNYPTIQDAINAANPGDTIFVRAGIYLEHVIVNKSISLIGEDAETTIINGGGVGTVVHVIANGTSVCGFTIQNSGDYHYWPHHPYWDSGIFVDNSNNCNLSNNIIKENLVGILLVYSSNNILVGNNVTNNEVYGIFILYSSNNMLRSNRMADNFCNFMVYGWRLSHFVNYVDASNTVNDKPVYYLINQKSLVIDPVTFPHAGYLALVNCTRITVQNLNLVNNPEGILLAYVTNSTVTKNNIKNKWWSIYLLHSSNNSLFGNTITENAYGIRLVYCSNNSLFGNNVTNNLYDGFFLCKSSNNSVFGNSVTNNSHGISLFGSSNNSVSGNNVTNNNSGIFLGYSSNYNSVYHNNVTNNNSGIFLGYSSNYNSVYHNNLINNTRQASLYESYNNTWDYSYPSGGNYWSDYKGVDEFSGPNQDQLGSDGIGDAAYVIDANNTDRYPLMKPYVPLLGDINYDRKVDMMDLAVAAKAFGSYPDHPRWNPKADVNKDGIVNIRDIAIIAKNFGKAN